MYNRAKRTKSNRLRRDFTKLRKEIKHEIKTEHNKYVENMLDIKKFKQLNTNVFGQ